MEARDWPLRAAPQAAQAAADEASPRLWSRLARNMWTRSSLRRAGQWISLGQHRAEVQGPAGRERGMSGSDTWLTEASAASSPQRGRTGFDLAVDGAWQSAAVLVKGDPESGVARLQT